MKRQRTTPGAILEIDIDGQYYVYAQILEKGGCAFFNYKTNKKLTDFSVLADTPILFILAVYRDVISQGHWLKVGKMEIREDLKIQPMEFIQDTVDPQVFRLYNPNTGEMISAKREDVLGLERAAVWEAYHVEDRIRDYYNGVPNVWVEQLKIKD